ncbi:MAG: glycogen-binding domain-containing protein [Limisphaerales bacterium]
MAKKMTSKNPGNGKNHLQTFSLRSPGATTVQLVGDFTQWQEHPITLHKDGEDIWKASVELSPGAHHYRFIVDGKWCDDPECVRREPNPFGGENMMRLVA